MTEPAPRLPPLPLDRWDDDVRAAMREGAPAELIEKYMSTGPDAVPVPNVLGTLAHHPAMARPFLKFNAVLLRKPTIEPRLRELMVLRVAWRTRSTYEWAQHVRLAERYAVTPDDVAAIGEGHTAPRWSPLEADLLAATDQLLDSYRIDDDIWARLAEHFDERQLVELLFVVGTYTCLAMAFNSFGLQLDPEVRAMSIPPLPATPQDGAA